jgi:gluconate 2-dehydrogenase gamma chain
MNRRESIKALVITTVAAGAIVSACNVDPKKAEEKNTLNNSADRMSEEKIHDQKLVAEEKFFTLDEMATIAILADIIIPRDKFSGSATDAKVPEFIEFIVKDMPGHQVPLRGGLRWLDVRCLKRFNKSFKMCDEQERINIVDEIAYPKKAKPEVLQGVKFFSLMRDLTASGFYTTEMGYKDVGYMGNVPNQWNGVPDEVLKQYGLSYSEKELKECISFNS